MNIRTNINKVMFSIIIGVVICGTTTSTNATTMCVTDDNNSIILDPSKQGTEMRHDRPTKTWTTTFSYGTVSGIATCNSTSGTYPAAYPQYNFDNNHASSTGVYCWCRMTSPVRSAWVFNAKRESESDCASACSYRCADRTMSAQTFRESVYGSAGM